MNAIVFVLAEIQAIIATSFCHVTEHYRPVWRLADPKEAGERLAWAPQHSDLGIIITDAWRWHNKRFGSKGV